MIKNCKRCHRPLRVHNVEYCDICQANIDKTKENNVYKHSKGETNGKEN